MLPMKQYLLSIENKSRVQKINGVFKITATTFSGQTSDVIFSVKMSNQMENSNVLDDAFINLVL